MMAITTSSSTSENPAARRNDPATAPRFAAYDKHERHDKQEKHVFMNNSVQPDTTNRRRTRHLGYDRLDRQHNRLFQRAAHADRAHGAALAASRAPLEHW
jgi:hypothetical protein